MISMDNKSLGIAMLFIFLIGAGVGFHLTRLLL